MTKKNEKLESRKRPCEKKKKKTQQKTNLASSVANFLNKRLSILLEGYSVCVCVCARGWETDRQVCMCVWERERVCVCESVWERQPVRSLNTWTHTQAHTPTCFTKDVTGDFDQKGVEFASVPLGKDRAHFFTRHPQHILQNKINDQERETMSYKRYMYNGKQEIQCHALLWRFNTNKQTNLKQKQKTQTKPN